MVVSKATREDTGWKEVVEALARKHGAEVIAYDKDVAEILGRLKVLMPRYVGFVATPKEAGREYVAAIHQLTRKLDDDPYTDALWGIVTGYDAANAARIARRAEPLLIERVAAATDVELARCKEGMWCCELTKNRMVRKQPGQEPRQLKGPDDTTKTLVDVLNEYKAQCFITSGHASERDWQIGYTYRNGTFRCEGGKVFGLDTKGQKHFVQSDNPKVYLPVGNCLIGHVDGPDCMAVAYMNSAGVHQMFGYTVPSWYGYGGWGCLDYFVEQPGRYTFAEAFFANHEALLHRLEMCGPGLATAEVKGGIPAKPVKLSDAAQKAGLKPQDVQGLLYDRDTVAFYGDPAWEARMSPGKLNWEQTLTEKDGLYTFEIKPNEGPKTFEPINRNGSQRGGRPIFQWLPGRVRDVEIIEGKELQPVVTGKFILVPNPGTCDPQKPYRVVFRAKAA
ncbi:MAG: hypothetical protein ACYC35_11355 [Pirellulales bacterium]